MELNKNEQNVADFMLALYTSQAIAAKHPGHQLITYSVTNSSGERIGFWHRFEDEPLRELDGYSLAPIHFETG